MPAQQQTSRDGVLRGGFATLVRLLILGAAGISGYLLSVSLSGGTVAGCAPGSVCDAVLQSRWAYMLGIPVSALALVIDLALLLATFSCGPRSKPEQRAGAWEILLPCAVLVLGAALWFVALQALILRLFCPFCMSAHLCGGAAAAMLLARLPLRDIGARKDSRMARDRAVKLAAVAVALIGLFAGAQIIVAPKTYSVKNIPAATANAAPATNMPTVLNAAQTPPTPTLPATQAPAQFDLFGGAVKLDLTQVPVWGNPAAPHKLVSLYDYSCHHCALMHTRVVETWRGTSNQLAVISLPMPLDGQCNALIQRTPRAHQNACAYARIGLAVWRARREALEPFDDWMFEQFHLSNRPPALVEATNKAVQFVGAAAFDTAIRDPWIDQQLASNIAIYAISMRQYGNGSMPQFIIGTNIASGTLETPELKALVGKYLSPSR